MPIEFDPAWEYWTPDPDIADVMGQCVPDGFEGLPVQDTRSGAVAISGFRVGKTARSIDADRTRLAPGPDPGTTLQRAAPKKKSVMSRVKRQLPEVVCGGCRKTFRLNRPKQRYCGLACRDGRQAVPLWSCVTCGTVFKSRNPNPQFCTIDCRVKKRKEMKANARC